VVGRGGIGLGDPVATLDVAGLPLGALELGECGPVGIVVAMAGPELREVVLSFGRATVESRSSVSRCARWPMP
jgi:hypothetical protein